MEVKIKTKDFLIDATIEMVDGVMMVSPVGDVDLKKKKWKPGVGEIFYFVSFEGLFEDEPFRVDGYTYHTESGVNSDVDVVHGNCFKNKEEAEELKDKLNRAINKVKEKKL